eukprot:15443852-Alexandrium_andersonii.AAC.1
MRALAGLPVRLVLGPLPGETRTGGTARTRGLQRPLSPPSRALALHQLPPPAAAHRSRLGRGAPGATARHAHAQHVDPIGLPEVDHALR